MPQIVHDPMRGNLRCSRTRSCSFRRAGIVRAKGTVTPSTGRGRVDTVTGLCARGRAVGELMPMERSSGRSPRTTVGVPRAGRSGVVAMAVAPSSPRHGAGPRRGTHSAATFTTGSFHIVRPVVADRSVRLPGAPTYGYRSTTVGSSTEPATQDRSKHASRRPARYIVVTFPDTAGGDPLLRGRLRQSRTAVRARGSDQRGRSRRALSLGFKVYASRPKLTKLLTDVVADPGDRRRDTPEVRVWGPEDCRWWDHKTVVRDATRGVGPLALHAAGRRRQRTPRAAVAPPAPYSVRRGPAAS